VIAADIGSFTWGIIVWSMILAFWNGSRELWRAILFSVVDTFSVQFSLTSVFGLACQYPVVRPLEIVAREGTVSKSTDHPCGLAPLSMTQCRARLIPHIPYFTLR
jgi:hypothetical protein